MFRHYTIVQLTIVIVISFDYLENPDEAGDKVNNKVILTLPFYNRKIFDLSKPRRRLGFN